MVVSWLFLTVWSVDCESRHHKIDLKSEIRNPTMHLIPLIPLIPLKSVVSFVQVHLVSDNDDDDNRQRRQRRRLSDDVRGKKRRTSNANVCRRGAKDGTKRAVDVRSLLRTQRAQCGEHLPSRRHEIVWKGEGAG